MTTVLLTGFAPFGGDAVNPSWLAVQRVAERWSGSETLQIAELPVAFGAAGDLIDTLIERHDPDLVVATGLAAGRNAVTPERIAINIDDARIPDNAGAQPLDAAVILGGPAAYFSTLPIKSIVAAIGARGIRSQVSQTAGTFVCNHVFYRLMHTASARPGLRAGFVHVPLATEHNATTQPSAPIETIAEALRLVVRTSLDVTIDASLAGGALS